MASNEPPCGLCGDAGHTHDEHWILIEARSRGLHVVTDAEKAVLDAVADEGMLPDGYLRAIALDYAKHAWEIVARAELARREALKDSE